MCIKIIWLFFLFQNLPHPFSGPRKWFINLYLSLEFGPVTNVVITDLAAIPKGRIYKTRTDQIAVACKWLLQVKVMLILHPRNDLYSRLIFWKRHTNQTY
jgi:uncharacterized protein YhhL (DUF1145 family)